MYKIALELETPLSAFVDFSLATPVPAMLMYYYARVHAVRSEDPEM